jgi:hypothetical protein
MSVTSTTLSDLSGNWVGDNESEDVITLTHHHPQENDSGEILFFQNKRICLCSFL